MVKAGEVGGGGDVGTMLTLAPGVQQVLSLSLPSKVFPDWGIGITIINTGGEKIPVPSFGWRSGNELVELRAGSCRRQGLHKWSAEKDL